MKTFLIFFCGLLFCNSITTSIIEENRSKKVNDNYEKEEIDSTLIESTIIEFINNEFEKDRERGIQGKRFSSINIFGIEKNEKSLTVITWALMYDFVKKGRKIRRKTGSSIAIRFEIIEDDNKFKIINHKTACDGEEYSKCVRSNFPEKYHDYIFKFYKFINIDEMENEIENKAKEFFDVPDIFN